MALSPHHPQRPPHRSRHPHHSNLHTQPLSPAQQKSRRPTPASISFLQFSLRTLRSQRPLRYLSLPLQNRLPRIFSNRLTRQIPQPHNLLQLMRIVTPRFPRRINRRRQRNRHARRPRQIAPISQESSRPLQRHRNHRRPRHYSPAKRSQLKRSHANLRRERSLWKDKHRIPPLQAILHLVHLLQAPPGVMPVKRQMPHLVQKRSDERHIVHLALRHESVTYAQPHHHRQHVKITCMVRRVHFRPLRIHIFFPHHLHPDSRQRK